MAAKFNDRTNTQQAEMITVLEKGTSSERVEAENTSERVIKTYKKM